MLFHLFRLVLLHWNQGQIYFFYFLAGDPDVNQSKTYSIKHSMHQWLMGIKKRMQLLFLNCLWLLCKDYDPLFSVFMDANEWGKYKRHYSVKCEFDLRSSAQCVWGDTGPRKWAKQQEKKTDAWAQISGGLNDEGVSIRNINSVMCWSLWLVTPRAQR